VRLGVLGLGVVQVVGRQQGHAHLLGQPQQLRLRLPLDAQAVVHDLGIEVLLAEDVLQLTGRLLGLGVLTEAQPRLDLAADAAGGADDPVGVAAEQVPVHAGLVVLPLDGGQRAHPEEIVHALGRAREQGHVGVGAIAADVVAPAVTPFHAGLVAAGGAGSDVGLDADDRLDVVFAGLGPELVGAVDVAVVGRGDGRHALIGGRLSNSSMRAAPSSMEYSVWTWRWTKLSCGAAAEAGFDIGSEV
jgi:hypothetical protein